MLLQISSQRTSLFGREMAIPLGRPHAVYMPGDTGQPTLSEQAWLVMTYDSKQFGRLG